jgi:hypothetical protein
MASVLCLKHMRRTIVEAGMLNVVAQITPGMMTAECCHGNAKGICNDGLAMW